MKNKNLLKALAMAGLLILAINLTAQEIIPDDSYNYAYQTQLNYLIQLANEQSKELSEMPEFKHFCIWASDYATKLDQDGNLSSFGETIEDYYQNNSDIESDFELNWEYNSPDALWYKINGAGNTNSGQGLIISLWISPNDTNHIMAGGQFTGGLWETIDGGDNWFNRTENYREIQGISSIFVNPKDTSKIFITTTFDADGPRGYANGLYYSDDGGEHWSLNDLNGIYPNANAQYSPRVFLQNPSNDSIMYLLTPYRLYVSSNMGDSWTVLIDKTGDIYPNGFYSIWYGRQFFDDMIFDPADSSTVYVTGPEAFIVTENGQSYEDITDSLLITNGSEVALIIMVDADINYPDSIWFSLIDTINNQAYVVLYNKLAVGSHYTVKPTSLYQIGPHYLHCEISPKNPNHLIIGGAEPYCFDFSTSLKGKYESVPGFHNDIRAAEWPYSGDSTDFVIFGTDGGITKVYNFIPVNNYDCDRKYIANDGETGIRNLPVRGLDVSRYGNDILGIGTEHDAFILKKDGIFQRIFNGGDQESVLIDPDNPKNIYATQFGHAGLEYTHDMGENYFYFFNQYTNITENPPILFFKPNDTSTLYAGFDGVIWKFNTANITEPPVEYEFDDGHPYRFIKEVGINNDLENLFFISTNRYWFDWDPGNWKCDNPNPPYWPHELAMMRVDISENGVLSFTDLSDNLNLDLGLCGGPITGIALEVNENDTSIYVSFGNTSTSDLEQKNKKVYKSDDLGETWFAMAEGLPDSIPVNDIQYHRESGMLFLANDVGVYYYDKEDITWKNITWDLPPMTFNKIRFSFLRNKILVSSLAKGVWEADIPCFYNADADTIFSEITWNSSVPMHNDLIVENNAVLTIKKEVFMPPSAKIIVKRGGTLIVDGGKITSACGEMWQGVEVWGDPTRSSIGDYQGTVIVQNGGTIENAEIGIRTVKVEDNGGTKVNNLSFAGGIIHAVDANFLNNKEALHFFKYPATGYNYQNTSFINTSLFETDESYIGSSNPGYFVTLSEIKSVSFEGCEFINNTGIISLQSGIYSYNSQFYVDGYFMGQEQHYSVFDSLQYGIYAIASNPNRYADIRHTKFDKNFRGLYISGMTLARVTTDTFNINAQFSPIGGYGMYLNASTDYTVEDNDYIHEGDSAVGVGLIVNSSGTTPNEIYRNRFNNLEQGISAQENNGNAFVTTGLQILCNDFDLCSADVMVPRPRTPGWGIAGNQGSDSHNPEDMAGNLFYWESLTPDNDYDDINNQGRFVTYYYPLNTDYENVEPIDYTHAQPYNTVTIVGRTVSPDDWTPENGCPPGIDGGGGGGRSSGELLGDISEAQQKVDSTESLLALLIDGGNTEGLQEDVEYSLPPEAMAIYSELIDNSPYLSDTVVSTAIEKEDVLPGAMVRDVMVANPHSAKNDELMNKLDERWTPLPEYMKEQILQGKNILSVKEKSESKLAKFKLIKSRAMNTLARNWVKDTVAGMDSLSILYEEDNSLESNYKLAFMRMEQGAWSMGMEILNNINSQFELNSEEQAEYEKIVEYCELVSSFGGGLPDSSSIQELFGIMESEQGAAAMYALNTLINLDGIEYEEPIEMPEFMKSAESHGSFTSVNNMTVPQFLKVMPNPASGFIIVEYELEVQGSGIIEITDLTGKSFHSVQTTNLKDQLTIDTRNWKPGTYIASLKINGTTKKTVKFTISN